MLMVSDKTIHKANTLYKRNTLEKLFMFIIYQKYTLALMFVIRNITAKPTL